MAEHFGTSVVIGASSEESKQMMIEKLRAIITLLETSEKLPLTCLVLGELLTEGRFKRQIIVDREAEGLSALGLTAMIHADLLEAVKEAEHMGLIEEADMGNPQ